MFRSVDDEIAEIYNKRFRKLGPTPEASMWFSKKRQFERFDVIFNRDTVTVSNKLYIYQRCRVRVWGFSRISIGEKA
jgi:hypothetical protein